MASNCKDIQYPDARGPWHRHTITFKSKKLDLCFLFAMRLCYTQKKVHTKVRSKSFILYLVAWLWKKTRETADLNVWVQVLNNFRLKHIYKTPENSHAHCWDQVYNLRWTMRGNIPLLQCEIFCEVHFLRCNWRIAVDYLTLLFSGLLHLLLSDSGASDLNSFLSRQQHANDT